MFTIEAHRWAHYWGSLLMLTIGPTIGPTIGTHYWDSLLGSLLRVTVGFTIGGSLLRLILGVHYRDTLLGITIGFTIETNYRDSLSGFTIGTHYWGSLLGFTTMADLQLRPLVSVPSVILLPELIFFFSMYYRTDFNIICRILCQRHALGISVVLPRYWALPTSIPNLTSTVHCHSQLSYKRYVHVYITSTVHSIINIEMIK